MYIRLYGSKEALLKISRYVSDQLILMEFSRHFLNAYDKIWTKKASLTHQLPIIVGGYECTTWCQIASILKLQQISMIQMEWLMLFSRKHGNQHLHESFGNIEGYKNIWEIVHVQRIHKVLAEVQKQIPQEAEENAKQNSPAPVTDSPRHEYVILVISPIVALEQG